MPLRLICIPWAGQPHGIDAGVDWQNPLTSGLVALYTPTTGVLRPQPVATTWAHQNAPVVPHPQGLALQTNAAARHGVSLGPVSTLFPSGHSAGTVLVFRQCRDTTARQSALFGYHVSASSRVLAHASWSDGNAYWDFGNESEGSGRLVVPFAKSLAPETIAFVAASGLRQVWRNGVLLGSNAGNATVPANPNNFGFGWADGFDRWSDNDDLFQCAVFGRALTAAEIQAWSADPWQLFEAQRIWVPGSAAGVPLEGAATATATATGALTVAVPLAGAGLAVATATGALSVSIRLAGAGTATATATGGLSLSIPLSGAAVAQALASAALTQAVPLAGAAAAAATATGALTINVSLAGSAIAQAVAAADLTVTTAGAVNLAGAATATAAATGTLRLDVPLSGAALTLSSASGTLTQIVALSGAAAVASSATGGLDVSVRLSGAALVSALASAGLTVTPAATLAGAAVASADAAGTLTLRLNLSGAAVAQAVASGMLTAEGVIPAGTPGWKITAGARDWKITAGARDWKITAGARNWRIAE